MSGAINMLVRSFLQKQSLEECSLEELQALASEYPYSEAAQLLLAKKLYAAQATAPGISEKYDEQLQKTLILFQNPLWVQHLIHERDIDGIKMVEEDIHEPEQFEEEPMEVPQEPISDIHEPEQFAEEPKEVLQEPIQDLHEPEQFVEESIQVTQEPISDFHEPEQFAEKPMEVPQEPIPDIHEPEQFVEEPMEHIPEPEIQNPDPVIEDQEPAVIPEEQNDKPADLPTKISEPSTEIVDNDSALTFEPYHTVDYFASQGIKYTPEEAPKDKLSQQLKSFTEWLKAMKRLPVTESDLPKDEAGGKQVEQLAQHSIEDREVVTETMAEVWIKQGNRLKAIEVYEKLSLLDPSKSSYFAAKIDSLKIQ